MAKSTELAGFSALEQAIGKALAACFEGSTPKIRLAGLEIHRAYSSPEFERFREAYGRVLTYADSETYRSNFLNMSQARDSVMRTIAENPDSHFLMMELGGLKNSLELVRYDVEGINEHLRLREGTTRRI